MLYIIVILFTALWMYLCYSIAEKNGRDKYLAILLGLLFGLFSVIGYKFAGKTEAKKLKEIEEITRVQERVKAEIKKGQK